MFNAKQKKVFYRNSPGFSLVETLVAFGLFAIFTTIAVGGFARVLRTQRQASALIAANANASLVIEQMAREIRTGTNFCDGLFTKCSSLSELVFFNASGCLITYDYNNGAIERADQCRGNQLQSITADNIDVHYLNFILLGNKPSDGYPPRITVVIGVSPQYSELQSDVTRLQTTVSARQIDT